MIADSNLVLREYLLTQLGSHVGTRIYCPRAPENASLPHITFFSRGGRSTPYIPGIAMSSKQFDCWADSSVSARGTYYSLYEALQGLQEKSVTIDGTTYWIASAIEEVHGQDLVDTDIPNRFRVLSFWEIIVK